MILQNINGARQMLNECSYVNVDVRCPIYDVLLTVNNAGNFKKYHSLGLNQPKFSFKAIIEHGTHTAKRYVGEMIISPY